MRASLLCLIVANESVQGARVQASVQSRSEVDRTDCQWPASLNEKFRNPNIVGSGATACVYSAENDDGLVAIKVQKSTSKSPPTAWHKECDLMQRIRKRACSMGKDVNELVESFLPTCLEVDTEGSVPYYIMHAAGTRGIDSYKRQPHDVQLHIFSQLIGAMYGLHATGYTHNDLHGMNIVMDDDDRLAIIDFGELAIHKSGSGYKHDVNSVWAWTAQLAVCPSNAYPGGGNQREAAGDFAALRLNKQNFLRCLKDNWAVDEASISVFDKALENTIMRKKDQMLKEMWETPFVQSLTNNGRDSKFPWHEMDGCLDWNWEEIKGVKECTELAAFEGQCPIESRPGACYSQYGGAWACWTDGVDLWKDQCERDGYDGACYYKDYGKEIKVEELEECPALGVCEQQCATRAGMFGACFTEDTSVPEHLQCHCVKATNKWQIERSLLKGGCATKKIAGLSKTYTGLCKYGSYEVAAKTTTTAAHYDGFGVRRTTTSPVPMLAPGEERPYKVGQKIMALSREGNWRPATVKRLGLGKVLIHFDGFHAHAKRWVPELSPKLKKK